MIAAEQDKARIRKHTGEASGADQWRDGSLQMDDWHYDTAEDLEQTLAERLTNFPRARYAGVWLPARGGGGDAGVVACLSPVSRCRAENLPAAGSFLIVANHCSHLDAPCILAALPLAKVHRAFPAAAKDYFFVSLPRVALAGVVVNALPFDRETHIRQSLALCQKLLATPGNILILFPEGCLGNRRTGRIQAGHRPDAGRQRVSGGAVPIARGSPRIAERKLVPPAAARGIIVGKPRSYAHVKRGKDSALEIATDLHRAIKNWDYPTGTVQAN